MRDLRQEFGRIIRRRREDAGLSQEALADRAGLHRNYVSLIERGKRAPTILAVKRLADALQTTMVSLIGDMDDAGG